MNSLLRASILVWVFVAPTLSLEFDSNACHKLESYLKERIYGQDETLAQFSITVCKHLRTRNPAKPAIIVAHGPTGTGKSMTRDVAMDVLFNVRCFQEPSLDLGSLPQFQTTWGNIQNRASEVRNWWETHAGTQRERARLCSQIVQPTGGGPFYIIKYATSQELTKRSLERKLEELVVKFPQSVIVFEDIDKYTCDLFEAMYNILTAGQVNGVSLNHAIIILETNAYADKVKELVINNPTIQDRDELITMAQLDMPELFTEEWANFLEIECSKRQNIAKQQAAKLAWTTDLFIPYLPSNLEFNKAVVKWYLDMYAKKFETYKLGKLHFDEDLPEKLAKLTPYDQDGLAKLGFGKIRSFMSQSAEVYLVKMAVTLKETGTGGPTKVWHVRRPNNKFQFEQVFDGHTEL